MPRSARTRTCEVRSRTSENLQDVSRSDFQLHLVDVLRYKKAVCDLPLPPCAVNLASWILKSTDVKHTDKKNPLYAQKASSSRALYEADQSHSSTNTVTIHLQNKETNIPHLEEASMTSSSPQDATNVTLAWKHQC